MVPERLSTQELVDYLIVFVVYRLRQMEKEGLLDPWKDTEGLLTNHSWKRHPPVVEAVIHPESPLTKFIFDLVFSFFPDPKSTVAYQVAKDQGMKWAVEDGRIRARGPETLRVFDLPMPEVVAWVQAQEGCPPKHKLTQNGPLPPSSVAAQKDAKSVVATLAPPPPQAPPPPLPPTFPLSPASPQSITSPSTLVVEQKTGLAVRQDSSGPGNAPPGSNPPSSINAARQVRLSNFSWEVTAGSLCDKLPALVGLQNIAMDGSRGAILTFSSSGAAQRALIQLKGRKASAPAQPLPPPPPLAPRPKLPIGAPPAPPNRPPGAIRTHPGSLPPRIPRAKIHDLVETAPVPYDNLSIRDYDGRYVSAFFTVRSKADFERASAALHGGSMMQHTLYVERECLHCPGPEHPRVILQGLPPTDPGGVLRQLAHELKFSRTNGDSEGSFRVPSPDSAREAVNELDGKWVEGKGLVAWWETVGAPGSTISGFRPPPTAPGSNSLLPHGFIPPPSAPNASASTLGSVPPPGAFAIAAPQASTSRASNTYFCPPAPAAIPLGNPPPPPPPAPAANAKNVSQTAGGVGVTTSSETGDEDASEEAWLLEYLAEGASEAEEGQERRAKKVKRA